MSPATPPPCPHDLGPGTAVCLRCRLEQREQARARSLRIVTRAGLALAGVAVIAVIGNGAVGALRTSRRSSAQQPLHLLASTSGSTVRQQGEAAGSPTPASAAASEVSSAATSAGANSPAPAPKTPVVTARRGMALVIPMGRSDLRDSMYVERNADSAVVHFDTELGRTRRRGKFESVVRTTLPALYGAQADSMLAALPEGAVTGDRDLVGEIAVRGVRIPVQAGGTLELWPVTRPGRDGPLVVGYRARVTP